MYSPDSIRPVDPLKYIAENEPRFFRSGSYSKPALTGALVEEAILLHATPLHVTQEGSWVLISSKEDWLAGFDRDAFFEVVPFKEGGVNSFLSEILATVFASAVITIAKGNIRRLKGAVPSWVDSYEKIGVGRLVAFS